jgi:hypothetical protein
MRPIVRAVVAALLPLLLLAGCAEPTLDSEDLEGSIAELRDSLDAAEQVRFDAAMPVVLEASRGEVTGTEPFSLDGMTAARVLAEAERIDVRRELALVEETIAQMREVVQAEERLAKVRVLELQAGSASDERAVALVRVRNELDTTIDSGWLRIDVEEADGRVLSGVEFVGFRPALGPGQERAVRLVLAGDEARGLPPAQGAKVSHRFTSVQRGDEIVVEVPSEATRARAAATLQEAEARRDELAGQLRAAAGATSG